MESSGTAEPETPVVIILLFGANCTGKSTVGRLLAGYLPRCALIEVDALRYMVVGGLVAYSAGLHPSKAPGAYRQQCWMGVDNAVRLAHGFATYGFSSVIEGLEDACRPGTGWAARAFGLQPVCTVALLCDEAVVLQRWQSRGGGDQLPQQVQEDLRWYQCHQALFDCVVDTASHSPEHSAELIYHRCPRGPRGHISFNPSV